MDETDLDLPDGWYILYCSICKASILWTTDVLQQFPFDEWNALLIWIIDNQLVHDTDDHKEHK